MILAQEQPFFPRTMARYAARTLGVAVTTLLVTAPAGSADGPVAHDQPRAQVATSSHDSAGVNHRLPALVTSPAKVADQATIDRAKQLMVACQARYDAIQDYTCTFFKREAIAGKLSEYHVMKFKARTQPLSFYIKCSSPRQGREAIWIKGKNNGKVVAHDAGMIKVLAGTMYLDPKGDIAMEDNRHPITEAGLGHMIDTVRHNWDLELQAGVTQVLIQPGIKVGDRDCTRIETTHPQRNNAFIFHRARVYIDTQLGLPIRLEGFDWPRFPGAEPELVEEYTFDHLKVNVGLGDRDFDPANPSYAYGRF